MKRNTKKLNMNILYKFFIAVIIICLSAPAFSQETEAAAEEAAPEVKAKKENKPARQAYESSYWFDGQTGVVNKKNTLEFVIQHRFSTIGSSPKELLGLYGPSTNTRIGLSYSPIKNLSVGFGYTKFKYMVDLNAKYMLLTQTKSNSMPVSLTYYGNMGIEVAEKENYRKPYDRYNYHHELIIMRRFSKNFSAHLAPSLTHYNAAKGEYNEEGEVVSMENDTWGLSIGMRIKVSSQINVMLGYDAPLTQHALNQPLPSLNLGIEIATSNHAFQIFFTNNNKILPQENFMYNQNDISEGQFLIGFNITRLRSL